MFVALLCDAYYCMELSMERPFIVLDRETFLLILVSIVFRSRERCGVSAKSQC